MHAAFVAPPNMSQRRYASMLSTSRRRQLRRSLSSSQYGQADEHRGVDMRTTSQLIDVPIRRISANHSMTILVKLCNRMSKRCSECEGCLEMQVHSLPTKRRLT